MTIRIQFQKWLRRGFWVGIVVLVLAGFIAGWLWGRSGRHEEHVVVKTTTPEGAEQVYTCSMHPQVRTTNPNDKCPICGMDLIPVPTDGDDDDSEIPRLRLSGRSMALMQIQTHPVERREVEMLVRAFGRIKPDETRIRTITAWVPGRLDHLYVDFTGMQVQKDDPVAELYSQSLVTTQEELIQALNIYRTNDRIMSETARTTLAAARDRLRLWGLSEEQIQQIEQRGRVAEHMTISAPLKGTVIERHVSQGMYVEQGQPLYTLADLSHLWAILEIYESDLQWFSLGQKAYLTTEAYPGEQFEGTVTFIDPVVNDPTRTIRVRVELENPDGRLKPDMFVRSMIHASAGGVSTETNHEDHAAPTLPLVIPATAPLITGRRAMVYVQVPDADQPIFEPRQIVLGQRAGDYYIVREGLNEGDLVVTNGAFKIDSELQIRGRPSMMAPEGGAPPVHDHGEPTAGIETQQPMEASTAHVDIGDLLKANFELVEALAGDDPTAASEAARQARSVFDTIDVESLSEHDLHRWHDMHHRMDEALSKLADSDDLSAQRRHFETFSDQLTQAVQIFGSGTVEPVYQAMCPMVQGRKGYWLQPQRQIANPYHGASMLRCGEIVEDISRTQSPMENEHRH